MPRSLDSAAEELFHALAPDAPQDFMVWIEESSDCIMVGTAETAFTIRRKAVDDGVHVATARAALPHFIGAVVAAAEAKNPRPRQPAHIHLVPPVVDLSRIGRPAETQRPA